jgi:signal peptidase II
MVLKKTKRKKKTDRRVSKSLDQEPITSKGYFSIIIFLILIFIDRLTKYSASTLAKPIDYGLFSLTLASNTGAGFSILQNSNAWLVWVSVIVLGIIIYFKDYFPRAGFLLIITGLIGNLIDRIFYGYVVDFINFKVWPVFNLADSMITIGAILTLIFWIKRDLKPKNKILKASMTKKAGKRSKKTI